MTNLIRCVRIINQSEGTPPLIGPFEDLQELLTLVIGDNIEHIDMDTELSISFCYLTREELDELPDWNP